MSKEEIVEHPSFGLVSFIKTTGNPGQLFGSVLSNHGSYIKLRINKAQVTRNHGYETYADRERLIEVELSAAQFAELITTMNVSVGTPCTISRIDGKTVERPPEKKQESDKLHDDFKDYVKKSTEALKTAFEKIQDMADGKTALNKKNVKESMMYVETAIREFKMNSPYLIELFAESLEKMSQATKTELDAFFTLAVMKTGMEALGMRKELKADFGEE